MPTKKITLTNISKSFGDNQVLSNFSAEFPQNQVTCIMAPSGKGKTTLLRILMGLETADSGLITGLEEKTIAAVFQEERLCENLSALTNISIATCCSKSIIEQALVEIGLKDSIILPVSSLSGGMKRRVSILRAILSDSDILILDEPFKGLDEEMKTLVINMVKHYIQNKTVILVTHIEKEGIDLGASYQINL